MQQGGGSQKSKIYEEKRIFCTGDGIDGGGLFESGAVAEGDAGGGGRFVAGHPGFCEERGHADRCGAQFRAGAA